MAGNSILRRLAKLEVKQRFLDWFAKQRFYHTLTQHELMTFALNGQLPDPIPERPSTMDGLDRKSLHQLWKEYERTFGGRSQEELAFFCRNGFWPEQRGRFHYSMHDGNLIIEWLIGAESEEPIDFGGNQ
jgi:hypothetical protein